MAGTVRANTFEIIFNGADILYPSSARVSLGYDLAVGEAVVTVAGPIPTSGTYYDDLTIIVNGSTWFSGILLEKEFHLYPQAVALHCKGRMYLLQQFKVPEAIDRTEGITLANLTGSDTATDEQIVQAVLDYVGVSTNGGSIGGTGTVLGSIAPQEFVWKGNESALDYIHRIDAISLGYRTFESTNGQIFRSQITTRPSSAELTFTEGIDISEGTNTRSIQEACNAVRVGGYAVGDYADPRVWFQQESNDFQGSAPHVFSFDSPMIERRADSSPGQGISCEAVANYWLGELNRELVKLQMTTPRDDDVGPGQSHLVQGPGGSANRLGIGENVWVQRVDKEISDGGAVKQTMQYVGGGTT